MSVTIVAGGQWGDEGKGKVVDHFAGRSDLVIRCQGGPNAGHTVINDLGKFVLHTVPSGIFNPEATCIVGAGTVVNPALLMGELQGLIEAGINITKLVISERAHVIMPYHQLTDQLDEERLGSKRIGSTRHGIAWAYADKAARRGFLAGELKNMAALRQRLIEELPWRNQILSMYGHQPLGIEDIMAAIEPAADFLRVFIGDTVQIVQAAISAGDEIMLEGQLGAMRDIDWGAYPFVTSSNPTPAGLCSGAGISPVHVKEVVGVVKAYTSAVGEGPFPTELTGSEGDVLREQGGEYGATTGRPRRCGWFDAVAVKWASQVAGFTSLALTKIDVLDGRDEIPICVGYELDGQPLGSFPLTEPMGRVIPVYKMLPGWDQPTLGARTMGDLPKNACDYIDELERLAGVPITLVSVGPERDATIDRLPEI